MSRLGLSPDPKPTVARRIEVISGAGGRRRWSDEEKAQAIEESLAPDAVVSQVARRHGVTPQQLFPRRREARRTAAESSPPFAPAIVEGGVAAERAPKGETPASSVIEIEIGDAHVWIWREAEVGMATAILRALQTTPRAKWSARQAPCACWWRRRLSTSAKARKVWRLGARDDIGRCLRWRNLCFLRQACGPHQACFQRRHGRVPVRKTARGPRDALSGGAIFGSARRARLEARARERDAGAGSRRLVRDIVNHGLYDCRGASKNMVCFAHAAGDRNAPRRPERAEGDAHRRARAQRAPSSDHQGDGHKLARRRRSARPG